MTVQVVTIDISTQSAPAPSTLLSTGAFISQGGTTLATGVYGLITDVADLAALLIQPLALTSITWSGSVATATTTAPHGFATSSIVRLTIAGAVPAGYNGAQVCTITGTSTFTYPQASNPGSENTPGTYVPTAVSGLVAKGNTYFAQNGAVPCYVLELSIGTDAAGVTALGTFITASPQFFSRYLVPQSWNNEPTFETFVATFAAPGALTYFHIQVTSSTYTNWLTQKAAICCIAAPTAPATEFTAAARFALELATAPSSNNKVPPMAFRAVFGVTPYPTLNNAAFIQTLQQSNVDYIGTAAQGGFTTSILFWGKNMDGNPFNYWYAADWDNVNLKLDLTNEVINGSNNPLNPLYYNQQGINRLIARAEQTLSNGAVYGLNLSTPGNPITVVGEDFADYVQQNPSDYGTGTYNGLSATVTPQLGFLSITFQLQISNFAIG